MRARHTIHRVACIVVSVICCSMICRAKRGHARPGLLDASHLVVEISSIKSCVVPSNAITWFNVDTRLTNKVDFAISGDFNITRNANKLHSAIMKVIKCREVVSSNTCESFQTWRFEKDVCKQIFDHRAMWKSALEIVTPAVSCPIPMNTYHMKNFTLSQSVIQTLPVPWEGNVWKIRFITMENEKLYHFCTDVEMRTHRVRH